MAAYEVWKWLKSCNASNEESKRLANKTRKAFGLTPKEYRQLLSWGREETKVLEHLMSANRFDEIEFDKIPSRAGLLYQDAFDRRNDTKDRYEAFAKNKSTKVNTQVLYPYEVVNEALVWLEDNEWDYSFDLFNPCPPSSLPLDDPNRLMINKYWENLPDYFNGNECKMLCMVDNSSSMTWFGGAAAPINVAISLGIYCAERLQGPYHNYYLSFSHNPKLVKVEGVDFVDKVSRIYEDCICENTDLLRAFALVRHTAETAHDAPDTIVILSDMEMDDGCDFLDNDRLLTEMEEEHRRWDAIGIPMPRLVYWNLQARQDNILDLSDDVSYVSGFSPVIFKEVLTGKTGIDLMMETLSSERYEVIH